MENPGTAAATHPFFGEPGRVRKIRRLRKFFWSEFVLVLVVVARVAPPNDRLLVGALQNFFVGRGEFKIYHRIFPFRIFLFAISFRLFPVSVCAIKLRLRPPAMTPCACRDTTSRPG